MPRIYLSDSNPARVLLTVFNELFDCVAGEEFFLSREGMRKYTMRLAMSEYQFSQSIYSLRRRGFLEKTEEGFLITPLGSKVANRIMIEQENWHEEVWDGYWKVVIFDIPESKRFSRNIFRRFLKSKGFYRLQDSVFISPYIKIDSLNFIRHEYGIAKYVNLLVAKSGDIDDDKKLKEHFDL